MRPQLRLRPGKTQETRRIRRENASIEHNFASVSWFKHEVPFNLPIRASCKKYSPRRSIAECDMNSHGEIPGDWRCATIKSPELVEMRTERITAISQVMTGHSR